MGFMKALSPLGGLAGIGAAALAGGGGDKKKPQQDTMITGTNPYQPPKAKSMYPNSPMLV